VLTQALGDNRLKVRPDVTQLELKDNDCLLLCTDGLTEMVGDQVIGEMLGSGGAAQATCQRLVERALEAGGKDNVTVVVARYRLP
jgi:protein phosphatase